MPTWPTDLPQKPLRNGYKAKPEDLALREKPDIGDAMSRPLATAHGVHFEISMLMTKAQLDSLETFYYTTLASGTLEFDWVHPRKRTAGKFKFTAVYEEFAISNEIYRVALKIYLKP